MDTTTHQIEKPITNQAITQMYEEYSPEIYRYAYRLLGDQNTAEDCVAEVFSRFLNGLQYGNRPRENSRAYLFRIAHNWIADYYRSKASAIHIELVESVQDFPGTNPALLVSEAQEVEQVRSALRQLSREQQMVIQLRFLEDWSHDEVAHLLGKTSEATRALQYRALAALRHVLNRNNGEQ